MLMRTLNLKFPFILDIFLPLLPSQASHFALFLEANMLGRKKWEVGEIEFSVHETG